MNDRLSFWNYPFRVFALTVLLASVGIVIVYSASASYAAQQRRETLASRHGPEILVDDHVYHQPKFLAQQCTWLLLGLVGMFAAYRLDYRKLKTIAPYLLGFSFLLLALVWMPGIGAPLNNHHRWIGLAGRTFQPSELAKLALVIYMARMLTDRHEALASFIQGVAPALAVTGVFAAIIVVEPDVGAAVVLTAITFVMWYVGGMRIRHLTALIGATVPAFALAIVHYRLERILAFINPSDEARLGKGYQLWQSLIAVGSGGMSGVGLGNSMQKYWLTEQFSDFVFAIACEELGFIGAALIVFCFLLLIWEGWRIALNGPDYFATLLAAGITLMLAINTVINIMVVIGLLPTKGLVLPLLSYGGSNMLVTMTSMGVLMNIGKYVEQADRAPAARRRARQNARPRAAPRAKKKSPGFLRPGTIP